MKSIIVFIAALFLGLLSCFAQQSLRDPLYLGPHLIDKPNVEAMAKLCEDYKLIEVPSDDDFKTFKHSDGTLIKFKVISDSIESSKPYVEVHTSESNKNIHKILVNTGFHKEKGRYEKGFHGARKYTTCQIIGSKNKRVIFSKEKGKF